MCDGLSKGPFIKSAFLKQQRNTCWKFPASKEEKIATFPSCQHEGQNESSMQWWRRRGTESCLRVDLNWHWMAAKGRFLGWGVPSCLISSRARALTTSHSGISWTSLKTQPAVFPLISEPLPEQRLLLCIREGAKYFFYLKQAQGREWGGGLKNSMADTCMGQEKI